MFLFAKQKPNSEIYTRLISVYGRDDVHTKHKGVADLGGRWFATTSDIVVYKRKVFAKLYVAQYTFGIIRRYDKWCMFMKIMPKNECSLAHIIFFIHNFYM